jgi:outer membrane protein TolC
MPELVQANNEAKLVKAQLNKLLGSRIDEPVEPTEKLDYSITEIKEAEFLNTAYKNKPEMMLQALNVDLSKWSIEMAKSGAGPNISMDGEYYYRSGKTSDMFNDSHKNWYWGASVSIPIFDGFSTMSKINEARALYAKAKIDKDNLTDQIAVDIRQACLNLTEALQLINSQKDNIEEAHEALKIAEVSYDNGVGTNLDVLDAQVALAQIQTNLASGIYDYLMAQAQLDRTMGKSYITEDKNDKR